MIGIKNIAQQKADKGIGASLAALSDVEDDELYEFGGFDGQDLILKHQ